MPANGRRYLIRRLKDNRTTEHNVKTLINSNTINAVLVNKGTRIHKCGGRANHLELCGSRAG